MIYMLETTDWKDNTPNHIYIFEDKKSMKCLGYIIDGTSEINMFNSPLPFNKRKRTFREIIIPNESKRTYRKTIKT